VIYKGGIMLAKQAAAVLATTALLIFGYSSALNAAQKDTQPPASETSTSAPATDDVLTAGRRVNLENEVSGDVAAAGAEVTIHGPVDGYVMSAGRTVTLHGRVGNDVWAAGETVSLDSSVGNNANLAGSAVTVGPNAVIGHDARLAGNTVTAEGRIERNLNIGADTARIGGDVGGTVHARADRVSILPGAVIRGDLVVRASRPPEISPDAKILGEVRYDAAGRSAAGGWIARWLYIFLALLVLGTAAALIAPAWAARVAATMRTRTSASIIAGFLTLLLIPLAIAALAVTIIGIPLAIVLLAIFVAILALSSVFVSYRLGEWLMTRFHRMRSSIWARMVLGVLLVSLLISLPTVGLILSAIIVIVGAGALVLAGRSEWAHSVA
jgi:hypothetical protein